MSLPRSEAAIPNPALEPFSVLLGEWKTTGTHPFFPDTTFHGQASFAWFEAGAFLIMRSEIEEPGIPTGVAIIGSDGTEGTYGMLYFDERGVSRKYEVALQDNVWKWWRDAPGFRQRFTGTIAEDGKTITGKGELSRDGTTWEKDLALIYTRQ